MDGYEVETENRTEDALEVADFPKECPRADNPKANPQTPHQATENCDDFVAEELRLDESVKGPERE